MLLDEEGKTLASDEFDLKELGDIPARSARPWVFVFTKDNIFAEHHLQKTGNWHSTSNRWCRINLNSNKHGKMV